MTNTPKILIFSTAYVPFVGGAEVSIKEITDRLSGKYEFDLITAKMKKGLPFREKIGNVTVYRLGIGVSIIDKLILPFEGALFARHLMRKNTYQCFWCMMVTFASLGAFIKNTFSKNKIPVVLSLQEGDSEEHFRTKWFGLINLSWEMALSRTQYLTVLSKYLKDRAQRLGYNGKVEIVPNGVDIKSFDIQNFNPEERKSVRDNLGLKEDDIILITTSRLVRKNGISDVIKALPKLPSNIKFIVCGVGELEKNLKSEVKKLRLEDRVIFVGNIGREDLPKYLKSSDIFIRPSLSEGFGNSFIEAMAAKIPVIATPVGGIPDFLEDGVTGYVCKPKSPNSAVEAVNRAKNDPRKNEVLDKAYQMVKDGYNWDSISSQMGVIFDSLK